MKIYQINEKIKVEAGIDEVWGFFSNPKNLKEITPKNLNFKFISGVDCPMIYPGKLIEYKVHPILGLPLQWVTEITAVKDREYFIDEQRFGPYKLWHHLHMFKEVEGGVEVRDQVHYAMPFGLLGQIGRELVVKSQLKEIFQYRKTALERFYSVLECE